MQGHDRHNTTILSVIHNVSTYDFYTATKADQCESQLPLVLAAITTPQYQQAYLSSLRHPIDTSGNNGEH